MNFENYLRTFKESKRTGAIFKHVRVLMQEVEGQVHVSTSPEVTLKISSLKGYSGPSDITSCSRLSE